MIDADQPGNLLGRDHASGGARYGHLDRRGGGRLEGHFAAVGLDHGNMGGDAAGAETLPNGPHLTADDRLDVGIRYGGRGALVFLPLGHATQNRTPGEIKARSAGLCPL